MNIKLCKNKNHPTRKGKYIDRNIAKKLTEIELGVNAFRERKYAKAIQYLGNKALNPKATDRIRLIVGASYVEISMHEKEASELLNSIIQKYKDEPKEKRTWIYSWAVMEYAKIQLRNNLLELAICLLQDINVENERHNIYVLIELAKAYDAQAQNLRENEQNLEAVEAERKAEKICLKCKGLAEKNKELDSITLKARNLLGSLYIRQGRIESALQEFNDLKQKNPKDIEEKELCQMNCIKLLKNTYFEEETEAEVNKRIERIEKKLEPIENGEKVDNKDKVRELNAISRLEFFEESSLEVKISNGTDVLTGYKMYEYPNKGIYVIDKIFDESKNNQKTLGITYIFPQNIEFDLEKLSRYEILNLLNEENGIQRQEHNEDYYNIVKEKMKRAELEGLVIEEKELKEKEEKIKKEKNTQQKKEDKKEGE